METAETTSSAVEQPPADERKSRKKHKKVRSAWISFIGRIIAQFVGSAATIVLGLLLLHKYQPTAKASAATNAEAKPVAVATTFHRHDGENSMALLPLRSFSRERADTDIADSMTDVVTVALASIPGLRVVSRTAGYSKDASRHFMDQAESLGVRYVLDGSVTQADGHFRVIVRLVDTERDEQMWAGRYDRPLANIFKMQDEIAEALVRDVKTAIFDRDDESVPATWTTGASSRLSSTPLPLTK